MTSTSRAAPPIFPAGGRVSAAVTLCAGGAGRGLTCSSSGGATGVPRPALSPGEGARDPPCCDPPPLRAADRGAGEAPRGAAGWLGTGQRRRGASQQGSEVSGRDRAPPHRRRAAGPRRRRRRAVVAPPGLLTAPAAAAGAASPGCLLRNLSPILGPAPRLPEPSAGLRCLGAPRRDGRLRCALLLRAPREPGQPHSAREPCPTARPDVGLRCLALGIQPAGR